METIKIDRDILINITDINNERNIYVHPNFLARDIFWQRLIYAFKYVKKYTTSDMSVLDFGGGSGVFAKSLSNYFKELSIIDLDLEDAKSIAKYFNISNINFITEDINKFSSNNQFDFIIATDVLEHFENLDIPLNFFNKFLKKNGLLLVTLPTENWIYELGRKIVNKDKPKDHYHTSKHVVNFLLKNGFTILEKCFVPKYILEIPLFEVVILEKKA